MRGGWRSGAGRPAWHTKTSLVHRIDVRHLHRKGHLDGYRRLSWAWEDGTNINMNVSPGKVIFDYSYRVHGDEWKPVNQPVTIATTNCNYGGMRPWFICPRCYNRVAVLFIYGWPACRRCKHLVYPSQSEDSIGRNWRKIQRLENQLSGYKGSWNYKKPKGMHWRTFEKLSTAYYDAQEQNEDQLVALMNRMGCNLR